MLHRVLFALLLVALLATACVHAQPESPTYREFDLLPPSTTPKMDGRAFGGVHILTAAVTYPRVLNNDDARSVKGSLTAPVGSVVLYGSNQDVWVGILDSAGVPTWYLVSSPDFAYLGIGPGLPNVLGADVHCSASDPRTNRIWMLGRVANLPIIWWSNDGGFSWTIYQSPDNFYLFRGTNDWSCAVDSNSTFWAFTRQAWYYSYTDGGMVKTYPARYVSERLRHVSTTYFSNSFAASMIYIAGGILKSGSIHLNDVYVSRDYTNTWQTLTSSAAWPARSHFTFQANSNGVLIVAGGQNYFTSFNDLWLSADGGWSWWLVRSSNQYLPRSFAGAAFDNQGYLWLSGGTQQDLAYDNVVSGPSSEVFRSSESFSTASITSWARLVNLYLIIPGSSSSPCLGLQCWPGEASCRCSMTTPFDFRSVVDAPWWGRYGHTVVRVAGGFTYLVRDWSSSAVVFNNVTAPANSFVVFGAQQDTWVSPDNGATWNLLAGPSTQEGWRGPYPSSLASTYTVYGNQASCSHPATNTFYLVGSGSSWNSWAVFRSIGGISWTQYTGNTYQFPGFSFCIVESQDTIRYIGQANGWVSTNGGQTWSQIPSAAWFPWRSNVVGISYYSPVYQKTLIWALGGHWWDTDSAFNDVWATSDGGVTWACLTNHAQWPERMDGRVAITDTGVLALVGGSSAKFERYFNDAFVSLDGGYTWFSLDSADSFEPRSGAAVMTDSTGFLYVWGGQRPNMWGSDGYKSTYSLSNIDTWVSAVNPNVYIPPTGCRGLVCFPNSDCAAACQLDRYSFDLRRVSQTNVFSGRSHQFTYLLKTAATVPAIDTSVTPTRSITLSIPVNSFITFGGDGAAGDVWVSTDKTSWRVVAGLPSDPRIPNGYWNSFPDLQGQQGCRSTKSDVFYLLGGVNGTTWVSDVWRSEGGIQWTLQSTYTPGKTFPPRAYFTCYVDSSENIYVTGGAIEGSIAYADRSTYVSRDRGVTFSLVKTRQQYPWRNNHFGDVFYSTVMQRDIMYVIGGEANANDFNDVWATRDGGITWVMLTANADFPARSAAGFAITSSGVMVLVGGYAQSRLIIHHDSWMSVDGGFNWWLLRGGLSMSARLYTSLVFDESSYLWALGGWVAFDETGNRWSGNANDVWKSTKQFTDASIAQWGPLVNPRVVIARNAQNAPVLGLRCWPGEACSNVPRTDVPAIPVDPPTGTAAASSSSSLAGGAIAGIVIGVLVGVVILGAIAFFLLTGRAIKSAAAEGNRAGASGSKWQAQSDVEISQTSTTETA